MRKIILYSALTIDGFIARRDGSIDWLESFSGDYGYVDFLKTIDTTIMGNKTYQQVLSFGEFPYSEMSNYVFTRETESISKENHVRFISSENIEIFADLKKTSGKNIWLVGGGQINSLFLKHNLIDEMKLFIMPLSLGDGIKLFEGEEFLSIYELISTKILSDGVIEVDYSAKK